MFMRSRRARPIAIDIGSGSLKLVQAGGTGERSILAAAERIVPVEAAADWASMFEWLRTAIPECLDAPGFTGKRVLIGLPSQWTSIQHLQVDPEDLPHAETIAATSLPDPTEEHMTRIIHVGDFLRNDRLRSELVCLAFPRHAIFNLVELLHDRGCEVVDLGTQVRATVDSFAHLHRRTDDAGVATMYVDLGTAGTHCVIANGTDIVCARRITVGSRNFDQAVSRHLGCDLEAARAYRIAHDLAEQPDTHAREQNHDRRGTGRPVTLGSPMSPVGLGSGGVVPDCPDLLETIVDELRMAIRYDAGLFPERGIDRIVFLGAGAQSDRTCQHIVQALQIPGQRGDPMARYNRPTAGCCPSNWNGTALPSWAATIGLLAGHGCRERRHAA